MTFSELPTEIITEVISWLPTASSVSRLSQTTRHLHDVVNNEGWKGFQNQKFPSVRVTGDWKNAVRQLTTLSRDWDRRAILARFYEPTTTTDITNCQNSVWRKPRGQTMGYRPQIDSFDDEFSANSGSAREILVSSAGSELLFRTRNSRDEATDAWFRYKIPGTREGVDDIMALKLLPPSYQKRQSSDNFSDHVLYGTASGELSLLHINSHKTPQKPICARRRNFESDGKGWQSISFSPSSLRNVVAAMTDGSVALYPLPEASRDGSDIKPIDRFHDELELQSMRIWDVAFLSEDKLAVALGPSQEPLQVYALTPSGFDSQPLRKFGRTKGSDSIENRLEALDLSQPSRPTTVSKVVPLPESSSISHASGNVCLSGSYDGTVRLHDLRSPSDYEISYFDATSQAAVYSLATLARERLVAGYSSHNLLKFFDLRVSGGRAYSYDQNHPTGNPLGWNMFIGTQQAQPAGGRGGGSWQSRGRRESPVYSLSIPSATSPYIYAGLEDNLVQMQFASKSDYDKSGRDFTRDLLKERQPNPVAGLHGRGHRGTQHGFSPKIPRTAIYDHIATQDGDIHMKILSLDALEKSGHGPTTSSLDERWMENRFSR